MTEISSIVGEEIPVAKRKKSGLRHWMQEASRLRAEALQDLDEETVHDLRVALRRCRAMVQTIREVDDAPGWRKLNRAAREVFQALGELRDTQVQLLWLQHLSSGEDILAARLRSHLQTRERELRVLAGEVIEVFDEKRWEKWTEKLPERLEKLAGNVLAFEELARRRLEEIEALDTKAAFERDEERYHELRIAVKHLRYVVENFLPELDIAEGRELKHVQDLLGEAHDLCVLRESLVAQAAPDDEMLLLAWRERIAAEYGRRIGEYRRMVQGAYGIWERWRRMLDEELDARGEP